MANLITLFSPAKALQIAKLVLLSVIGASVAVLVGTHTGSFLSAAAPPYLFLLVHVIVAVIWKLSDRKPPNTPTSPAATEPAARAPLPEAISPDSGESCVTDDDSDAKSPASVGSARGVVEEESGKNDDHMDETWRAIVLKKSDTWERTRRPEVEAEESTGGRRRMKKSETFKEPSEVTSSVLAAAADDEWNQRFDAFIKKNYDQIRLQNGGAYRRHMDFENHASH